MIESFEGSKTLASMVVDAMKMADILVLLNILWLNAKRCVLTTQIVYNWITSAVGEALAGLCGKRFPQTFLICVLCSLFLYISLFCQNADFCVGFRRFHAV